MEDVARRKVANLLGLGARARSVVTGVDLVRGAVQGGKVSLVLVASDAARNSREKILPLLLAKRVECIEEMTGAELGDAVGKGFTAAVGVTDAGLARGIREAASALRKGV